MPNKCQKFLSSKDELGSGVHLHHKGSDGYGTAVGGCMSLLVNTFSAIFIIGQFYGFFFQPSYS